MSDEQNDKQNKDQNGQQNSNIPLLRVLKKRGKASASVFSFRPTRSMSNAKSIRKPRPVIANVKAEADLKEKQKES